LPPPCLAESLCLGPLSASAPPPAQLPSLLGKAQLLLGRLSTSVAQLDALLIALPLFTRVQLPPPADAEGAIAPQQLQLVFLDIDARIRATVSLPFLEALLMGHSAAGVALPGVQVEVGAPTGDGRAAAEVMAALETALAAAPAGPAWLQHVCFAAQEVLQQQQDRGGSGDERRCCGGERRTLGRGGPIIRVFDNSLGPDL
jgi:hypothetical protein